MCLEFKSIRTAEEDLTFYKEVNIQDGKFITPCQWFPIDVGKEYALDTNLEELVKESDGEIGAGIFHLYAEMPCRYYYPFVLKTTVKKGEKYLVGRDGDVGVTRVRYEYLNEEEKGLYEKLMKRFPKGKIWEDRSEGVFWIRQFRRVSKKIKINLISAEGKLLFKKWFDEADETFKNGLAAVKLKGKWNFINPKGEILSKKWFDEADEIFENGLAAVALDNKYNFISTEGKLISTQWFDSIRDFSEGFAGVKINNKWNFINTEGKLLSDKWFDFALAFVNGFADVKLKEEWKKIDTDGNIIE